MTAIAIGAAADDAVAELADQVRRAAVSATPLEIRAGGSKAFYGNAPRGERLDPRRLQGIVAYEPSELVVTVRAGTRLAELETVLAATGQMLAFEPPHFGAEATVGGCIASGLAGPRRAAAGVSHGSVRDFVLGARLLDGRARILSFGGTVMKNVAGYDVARLLAGSLGILGIILEVSLKVLPRPAAERTLRFEMSEARALDSLSGWGGRPLPVSASAWHRDTLHLRLSGAEAAVRAAEATLGGEPLEAGAATRFWHSVREQTHAGFDGELPLWRLSLPSTAPPAALAGAQLIEWGGALRWLRSAATAEEIRARAAQLGGHATRFRAPAPQADAFTPLAPAAAAIQRRLKASFDPDGIFNPGRLYPDL